MLYNLSYNSLHINCLYLLLFIICLPQLVLGQNFSVSPQSVSVTVNEPFSIEYTLTDGNLDDFQAPDFRNFTVLSGPNRSTQMQIINGNMNQSASVSYTLQTRKKGKLVIPPAIATSDKKTFRSKSVIVQVGKGSKARAPQAAQRPGVRTPQKHTPPPAPAKLEDQIFFRAILDTTNFYQGQQVTVFYRVYTTLNVTNYSVKTPPAHTGFWVQELEAKRRRITPGNQMIDSVLYRTLDLKKYALFPQRTGVLNIDPMEVEIVAQIKSPARTRSIFQTHRNQRINLKTDTLKINVYPPPDEGRPIGFNGAVGEGLKLHTSLDTRQVKVNESFTLSLTISGKGNIKLLEAPIIVFPETFEVFDPVVANEDVYEQNSVIKGIKKFDYTLVPNKHGWIQLPKIEFPYFDSKLGEYKVLSYPPHGITVAPPEGVDPADLPETVLDTTLASIKQKPHLSHKDRYFFTSWTYSTLFAMPFIAFPLFLVWYRRREAELSDVVSMKRKLANKVAAKSLTAAKTLMEQRKKQAFYTEVKQALLGYLRDKFNLPNSELSKEHIAQVLTAQKVSETTIQTLLQTISYCEMALFAPVADADNLKGTYEDTAKLIADVEEELEG